MPTMQNVRADISQQIRDQVRSQVQAAQDAAAQAKLAGQAGKTGTTAPLPPELLPMARMAQDTAYGLFAMIIAVVVLGPFARMIARRMDRRTEIKAAGEHSAVLSQQMTPVLLDAAKVYQ